MPRPVSWLPRLHEIRRSVANSVRSHYNRQDIEKLFQLQPRAASALMEMLPKVMVNRGYMVERESLSKFLDRVHRAENVTEAVKVQRAEREGATRSKPRALVRRDREVVRAETLAAWVKRGRLEIPFATAQELFDALWRVAGSLDSDLEAFIALYVPTDDAEPSQANEMDELFAELDRVQFEGRKYGA
jgi:hypothetical protein